MPSKLSNVFPLIQGKLYGPEAADHFVLSSTGANHAYQLQTGYKSGTIEDWGPVPMAHTLCLDFAVRLDPGKPDAWDRRNRLLCAYNNPEPICDHPTLGGRVESQMSAE